MKKIGFVIPWYGDRIPGGAEMEARTVVKHLIKAGVEAEVLTTCVKEFTADWNVNYYQEGLTDEAGVPVRRFLVRERDTDRFNKVNLKLMNNIRLTAAEEETFMREMVNSPDLYDYIENNKKKYDLFVLTLLLKKNFINFINVIFKKLKNIFNKNNFDLIKKIFFKI